MKTNKIISSLAVLALAAAPVFGQDESAELRRQMRNNVGTLRLLRLTQTLNLTEEQTARIYPAINRLEREKVVLQQDLAKDLLDLRRSLRPLNGIAERADRDRDERLRQAVRRIGECRRQLRMKEDELEVFLEKTLTPVQQARYDLFQIDFNQGLGDVLNRARMRRQGQLQPAAPVKK